MSRKMGGPDAPYRHTPEAKAEDAERMKRAVTFHSIPAPVAGAVESNDMWLIHHWQARALKAEASLAALPAVDEIMERAAFVAEAKCRGWTPGDFMLGAYAGWLAAKSPPTMLNGLTEAESQWRTIESAPKDGEQILLGFSGYSFEGFWMGDATRNHWEQTGWFFSDDDILTAHPKKPHCWMPLPAPPTVGSGSATEGRAK